MSIKVHLSPLVIDEVGGGRCLRECDCSGADPERLKVRTGSGPQRAAWAVMELFHHQR